MEGSLLAGRYLIECVIGSGGMAIVYRARDRHTGEIVAVKVLRSEYVQDEAYVKRFEKESQIAIRYAHKNIVRTMEVGEQDGRHYIVMELVDGQTLKEYIAERGTLPTEEVLRLGWQICDALFYAHSHSLIHRDIKPQNILLNKEGVVKVADFGIAKVPDSTVTISGSNVLGSVHYISPEQARGSVIDEKADIYSIGVVLYEMVTGTVPFTGETPVAVALKHLQEPVPPARQLAPAIPKALELVILKAMAKDPAARYDNAREMARDLERTLVEPEGSYIDMRESREEFEGTRPLHSIREGSPASPTAASRAQFTNTGSRRPLSEVRHRPRHKVWPMAVMVSVLSVLIIGGVYLAVSAVLQRLNRPVLVPKVTEFTLQEAKSRLDAFDLYCTVQEKNSDKIAEGIVMSQNPKPDDKLEPGGVVELVVSAGRVRVEVPDVSGYDYKEAVNLITKAGLTVGDVYNEPGEQPKDTVLRQEPIGHEMLALGGFVNLWLSQPEDQALTMPVLFGQPREEAIAVLMEQGLAPYRITQKASSYPAETVVGQLPQPGQIIESDTQLQLWVSNGKLPGYSKQVEVDYDVPVSNSIIEIVFLDGDTRQVLYRQSELAGSHSQQVLLDSESMGQKTIAVLVDGQQVRVDTVTFTAEDEN